MRLCLLLSPSFCETIRKMPRYSPRLMETSLFQCNNVSAKGSLQQTGDNTTAADLREMTGKDASWILTSAVIIFTMQTGFGLLESGCVSPKNEVNIMIKNALDVVFGGITYWAFGFGLSFGRDVGTNGFVGVGCFLVDSQEDDMGYIFSVFLFQMSFATTATTIVSGAMAERTKLSAYVLFSMINTVIYSIPAHWVWSDMGFLFEMGALDVAGAGPVHLVGGVTALVATVLLKPRIGAFDKEGKQPLQAPLKVVLGMLMLWWGWLRFNSGSVFIVSTEHQWKSAVRAAINTLTSSMGGGITGVIVSVCLSYCTARSRYDVGTIVNSILGALVAVTAICTLCRPWEALIIGMTASGVVVSLETLLRKLKVDDPVGVIPVHFGCSTWGILCVGLFLEKGQNGMRPMEGGLFKTGQFYMLGVQALACVIMIAWTIVCSFLLLKGLDLTIGLRLSREEELMGADVAEHGVHYGSFVPYVPTVAGMTEKQKSDSMDGIINQNEANSQEFKDAFMGFFDDFLKTCRRGDIQMVVTNREANRMTFQLSLKDKQTDYPLEVESL